MYLPPAFREDRPEVLRGLIADFPLAALVTSGPDGLAANHVPLLYDPDPAPGAPFGILRGHLSKANPQAGFEGDALAIFQGPDAFVSPNWYPTKQETGRAVPTWNYAVVHAHGRMTVYSEPERLREFLDRLTARHEATQTVPWKPADAPPEYIEGLLRAIVGIEIAVTRLEGKWKTSQNQPEANRTGAADGLEAAGKPAMAALIRRI